MKKLIMLVMALVMVVAFMPRAQAADSAQLNLSVTFATEDLDMKRVAEIEDQLSRIIAPAQEIYDQAVNSGNQDVIKTAIEKLKVYTVTLDGMEKELKAILDKRPDLSVKINQMLNYLYGLRDTLFKYLDKLGALVTPPPVISIELNESAWKLDGVKLGEKRVNLNDLGVPIHAVKNTGNVPVMIDIGYAPMMYIEWTPKPGLAQGPNTFITALGSKTGDIVIPPDNRVKVDSINPGNSIPVRLTYGAPTALGDVTTGGQVPSSMGTTYEIRAYGDVVITPGPILNK